VCTGVMALATLFESDEGVWRGDLLVGCVCVSLGGLCDRGLGGLPGGEESVLVKGVRALIEAVCPGYDILLLGVEDTEGTTLPRELSEPIPFSRSLEPCSWSSGEGVLILACAGGEESRGTAVPNAERLLDEGTDESARREPARLRERLSLLRVLRGDNGGVDVIWSRDAARARDILWRRGL
jgi:hypothetical protein